MRCEILLSGRNAEISSALDQPMINIYAKMRIKVLEGAMGAVK